MQQKKIAILGSTGSIGRQALEVIHQHKDVFSVSVLTAGRNADLLIEQAIEYVPEYVVISDQNQYNDVKEALSRFPVHVLCGSHALSEVVSEIESDLVLAAMVGFSGLLPVYAAVGRGRNVALANKETLVVAGSLIMNLAEKNHTKIIPVDSEHSAIFQCLAGENSGSVEKLILTASGGPFRGMDNERLEKVTCQDALRHPNWCMGSKVTIDSASLMNKGLEVIEARWLFGIDPDDIDVVIHPQSIIHSLVQFWDGSIKAQIGLPDMRLPIQYALGYPDRLSSAFPRFNFAECNMFTFETPDFKVFRNLSLAYAALRKGGNLPCIMNAANEVAVEAFINERISFLRMPDVIEKTMSKVSFVAHPSLNDLMLSDHEAREMASEII